MLDVLRLIRLALTSGNLQKRLTMYIVWSCQCNSYGMRNTIQVDLFKSE